MEKKNKCESLKNDLRRFVRKYIFGQMSSGQKDGGLSAAVMSSAVMCPAAKWVDTIFCMVLTHRFLSMIDSIGSITREKCITDVETSEHEALGKTSRKEAVVNA